MRSSQPGHLRPPAADAPLPARPAGGRQTGSIIPAPHGGVTALSVQVFLAVLVALALRLVFVHWFPATSDDSTIYLQLARNWSDHHTFALSQNGQLTPTDLRMPGYPAFLAAVGLLFGRSQQAILLSQAFLDVLTCILTATLAAALAPAGLRRRVWMIGLWLSATCPFVANYTATVLTETVVTFFATAALVCFALGLRENPDQPLFRIEFRRPSPFAYAILGGLLTGVATLVRPEMPLLLAVAAVMYGLRVLGAMHVKRAVLFVAAMVGAFLLPLLPWAARNAISLKELQFLAPRYATLPGEYAPVGFHAWTRTWLERYRDVYVTVWRIGQEQLDINEIPPFAFDSSEERARVASLIAQYNDSPELDISPELDGQFAELALERTERHPVRTYVQVPFERALTIWFTPRTELLPIDGKFWPLREQWHDSHADVLVTGGFALLGYLYVALAIGGTWLAWRASQQSGSTEYTGAPTLAGLPFEAQGRQVQPGPGGDRTRSVAEVNLWGMALLVAYFVVRTAFLTTIEAPEPRYVVSCYPGVLALVALLAIRNGRHAEAN